MSPVVPSTPDDLRACVARLRRGGEALAALPRADLLARLERLGRLWQPQGEYARQARQLLTGPFQARAVDAALAGLAVALDARLLEQALADELGRADLLDAWRPETTGTGWVRGFPLGVVAHVLAGNVFLGGAMALAQALMTRNAVLVKLSREDAGFTALFAGSLAEADDGGPLTEAVAVCSWDSARDEFNSVLRSEADAVVVWGTAEAVSAYPPQRCKGKVIQHGPRLGVGLVLRDANPNLLDELAWDVALWEQRACSSPRLVFVEDDSSGQYSQVVARRLETALERVKDRLPPRPLSLDEKSEVLGARERAWWCDGAQVLAPPGSMSHTVLCVAQLPEAIPLGHRTVVVVPLSSLGELPRLLAAYRELLQTVVLAGPADRWPEAIAGLVRAGFTQVAAAGAAASRFLGLPHEGEFALRRLVRLVGIDLGVGPLVYPDRPAARVAELSAALRSGQ
jgi:hypothetical protein